MPIEVDLIKQLIGLMNENDIAELEVEEEGRKIRLCKQGETVRQEVVPAQVPVGHAPTMAGQPQPAPGKTGADEGTPEGVKEITSPMVGTFYRAPAPDADPYVDVGDDVSDDSIVCIIEAMKVMNEIKAECAGEVVEILVANGEAVEFGQPLFLVELD